MLNTWMTICHFNIKHKNMKIKKLIINNFRAFKHAEIDFDDFNCIIGKNDTGKSTILAALELFFDRERGADENDYNGIIDACNGFDSPYSPISIKTSIELDDEKLKPFLDNGVVTVCKQFEVNPIAKEYKPDYSIAIKRTLFDKNDINNDRIVQDKHFGEGYISKSTKVVIHDDLIFVPISCIHAPSVLELFQILPKFKLFTASSSLKELQNAYINMMFPEVVKDLIRTINKHNVNEEKGLRFDISNLSFAADDMITSIGEKRVPMSNRGEGYQIEAKNHLFRQLTELVKTRSVIFAFEEPETHLHPSAQIEMYETIKALSENPNYQVIITTHSPYIVKELAKDKITPIVIIRDEENNVSTISKFEETLLSHDDYVSMNEINYIAFEEPSVEYHQELFAFLQGGKQTVDQVDNLFKKEYDWFQVDNKGKLVITNGSPIEKKHSLPYCVRNQIDHPTVDDTNDKKKHNAYLNNSHFNEKELIRKSIEIMRNAIIDTMKSC